MSLLFSKSDPGIQGEADLLKQIESLDTARDHLTLPYSAAVGTVRDIADALLNSVVIHDQPELAAAAERVRSSDIPGITEAVDNLLEILRKMTGDVVTASETILIVEDDPTFRQILLAALEAPRRDLLTAETGAAALEILHTTQVDLMVLDIILPDVDGRNLLIRVREDPLTAAVPIVIVTAKTGPAVRSLCMAMGARDFFEKPVDPVQLVEAVNEIFESTEAPIEGAYTDPVTGLPTRAAFFRQFGELKSGLLGGGQQAALARIDLPFLNQVEESWGRAVSKTLLRLTSQVLRESLPDDALLAHWGGEEFILFFPTHDRDAADSALERPQAALRERSFKTPDGNPLELSFNMGVINTDPDSSLEDAVAEAEQQLYLGRGVEIASEDDPITEEQRELRILFAEDDQVTATVIIHRLRKAGLLVDHYSDGADALQAALKEHPSLCLFDVKMPGMDGFEIVKRLRAEESFADVPILMLTSMGSEKDIIRGFELGANDYILKPFSPTEVLARVQRFLRQK